MTEFHLGAPWWLLALGVPLLVWFWLRLTVPRHDTRRYQAYADQRFLPYLLGLHVDQSQGQMRRFWLWTLIWSLMVLALAAPRWDYEDIQLFRPGADLVVLLDISGSMGLDDDSPNRFTRAKQELEDLLEQNTQARIGLILFATMPHVVAPLTEDSQALRQLVPVISPDLVQLKGSRLPEALLRARQMLAGQPDESRRHVLLISDGDFGGQIGREELEQYRQRGIRLHVLGIGSPEGAPVKGPGGRPLKDPSGQAIMSRLDEVELRLLAELGGGLYERASYKDSDTVAILAEINRDVRAQSLAEQKTRVWNDRFFLPLGLVMLLLLARFRRLHREGGTR
jgi:Ca-activated chloride channel family protein